MLGKPRVPVLFSREMNWEIWLIKERLSIRSSTSLKTSSELISKKTSFKWWQVLQMPKAFLNWLVVLHCVLNRVCYLEVTLTTCRDWYLWMWVWFPSTNALPTSRKESPSWMLKTMRDTSIKASGCSRKKSIIIPWLKPRYSKWPKSDKPSMLGHMISTPTTKKVWQTSCISPTHLHLSRSVLFLHPRLPRWFLSLVQRHWLWSNLNPCYHSSKIKTTYLLFMNSSWWILLTSTTR